MPFTFIHTADWQLGKPFGGFPPETAALLREARLEGIDRIAAVAQAHGARHVLVAGDVFDSATAPDRLLGSALARLEAQADLVWHLLPGNHDPAEAGGIWARIGMRRLPANVRLCLEARAAGIEAGVALLPAPLATRAMATDPTGWMDACATPPGTLRIGLAHGSVQGFGSEGDAAVPIDPRRAERANLDYLALGDWHGVTEIGPRTWYSGTHEPDQFPANAPGFVLVVSLDAKSKAPRVTRVPTARYHWQRRPITLGAGDPIAALTREIDRLGPGSAQHLLKLELAGAVTLAEATAADAVLASLADRLRHLDVDRANLRVTAGAADIDALPAGPVRDIAARLQQRAVAGDCADAAVALRALRRLASLAAQGPGSS